MPQPNPRKRIAALVATPSKRNTGMRVVNDALVQWLESLGLLGETDFFQFETPPALECAKERVAYGSVLDLHPERYERLIVWGDFLLDRNWLRKACERIAQERDVSARDAERHVWRVIFGAAGEGAPPERIVAGQCFLVSDDGYEADRSYQEAVTRLAARAKLFLMRDPLSAARARAFTGVPAHPLPPLDAALLRPALRDRNGAAPSRDPAGARASFGLFFGRTAGGFAAKLASTLAAARFGSPRRARYMSWLPHRPVPRWVRVAARPAIAALPASIDEGIAALSELSFVVTDTYHLALVCWSIGVPAICLGAGAQRFQHSVHDKKKELFFLSQRIERFHLFTEAGFATAYAETRTMLAEIDASDPGPAVAQQLRDQAAPVLRALDAAIQGD